MKVIDASVGFKALVTEADSAKAIQLVEDYRNGVTELIAPDFYPVEVAHSLTRAERQGRITPAEGAKLLTTLLQDLPHALSSQVKIGVYDCLYVALAEQQGCDFVTAGDRLIRTLQGKYAFILALASI